MDRRLIICIVAETSTGKDSVANSLPYEKIVSYTTRPKRDNDINGIQHWFVSDDEMDRLERECRLIAWTNSNGYRYCAVADDLVSDVGIYIINPEGIRWFKENGSKDVDIVTIGLYATLSEREKRAKNRSDFKTEFYKRVAKEQHDFDMFRLNGEFDYLIHNHDLEMTKDIVKYIVDEEVKKWRYTKR